MGRISKILGMGSKGQSSADRSRLWRESFGVSKEDSPYDKWRDQQGSYQGGNTGRSLASEAGVKRLLQAFRSNAPGGWTDDRYEQSRHFTSLPYVAIHRQNELLTRAEFQVFRKDVNHPEGKIPVNEGEPGYELVELLEKPNPDDSFGDILGQINLQMDLTGSSLIWMVPNALGKPMELYPIPTATAVPGSLINEEYPSGYYQIQPLYPYGPWSSYPTPFSATGTRIPSQWMLRIKYPHPLLRYEGYSPLSALRLLIDEIEMMDRSRHYKMRRSSNPDAVMDCSEMEGLESLPASEIERMHAEWEANNSGPENAGRLIIPPPGMKLSPWGTNPVDMDYTSGWDQLTSFCLGGLGITKPAAGMVEDSSYATLFASLKQLYWLTLEPKAERIGRKLTRHLAPFFGKDLIVEVRCKKIDDHDIKLSKLNLVVSTSSITHNQLLRELEFPVTTEPWGEWRVGKDDQYQQQEEQAGVDPMNQLTQGGPEMDQQSPEQMVQLDEQMIANEQPNSGNLNKDSLGPRGSLGKTLLGKRFSVNGNGKHPKKLRK